LLSADIPADVEFDITMHAAATPIAGLHDLAETHDALLVWVQAANRLPTEQAVLATLTGGRPG
jgi:hypothetical protein